MIAPYKRPETPEELLAYLDQAMASIGGCGSANCCIERRPGQHTNGPCHCSQDKNKMRIFAGRMRYGHNLLREIVEKNKP